MKYVLPVVCCVWSVAGFSQSNITLLGHLAYPNNVTCANLTGYTDSLGREYALVGTSQGLSIVAIDTPTNPRQLFLVPGATGQQGEWREVREYKGYAYVTTEQASGLVVVNLHYLPDSVQYHTINPGGMTTSHSIFIDENGTGYINGTNKGLLFLDLNANLYNPPLLGKFTANYVHDCFARHDTMWAACINDGIIKVVDIHNKTTADNPANTITTWETPLHFAHNCWLSDDSRYIFTTDERPNAMLTCYDVSDLTNVSETDETQVDPGSNTIIHNTYFLNNYCITSYYTYGISIHDVARKNNLVEVGSYDTSPAFSGTGFDGAWGVWPYLGSGNIIASDIETGLWVLKPNYKRACYVEGSVKDSVCNTFLDDVAIEIVGTGISDFTHNFGKYSMGTPDSGTYTIRFSKNGYQTKDYTNVNLDNGNLTTINVNLIPESTSHLVIKTVDASNGSALPFVRVLVQDSSGVTYRESSSDANAEVAYCDFVQGNYTFYAGRWGLITAKTAKRISAVSDTVVIPLGKGYYDDFIMDYGWTASGTSSSGDWQRGEPVGTTYMGAAANPGNDVANDFGADCYVTGNNGGAAGDDDVDNGFTTLRSPLIDLSAYTDPYLSYYRWFFNDGGNGTAPNDSLYAFITNGTDSVLLDVMTADSVQSQWRYSRFRLNTILTPSQNMRIYFTAVDNAPGHLVEAALDMFQIVDSGATAVSEIPGGYAFNIRPNPVSESVIIERENDSPATLLILDMEGRKVSEQHISGYINTVYLNGLSKGIYLVKMLTGNDVGEKKMVKVE